MENKKINTETDDFAWIIKVLESSENKVHLMVCDKLFNRFINKWGLTEGDKFKRYCNIYDKLRFVTDYKSRIKYKNRI
jgi:hypothetical protein